MLDDLLSGRPGHRQATASRQDIDRRQYVGVCTGADIGPVATLAQAEIGQLVM